MTLTLGSGSRTPYGRDLSIDRVFADVARTNAFATAVTGYERSLTYGELERASNRVANALLAQGLCSETAIGVAFERSVKLPAVLLGILKAGAAYVPLDPSYPPERIEWMLSDAAIALVVADDVNVLSGIGARRVLVDDLLECTNEDCPPSTSGPASLAYIIYTSGSTGRPKGVAVEHRGVVRLVRGTDYVAVAPRDTFLQFAPLSFDASTFEIWAPLLNGASLSVPRPGLMTAEELAATIDRFGVTTMFLTTALFQRLVDAPSARPKSLRTVLTGGEVASPAHMARFLRGFPECRLVAVYGPTENTTFSTWCDITQSDIDGSSIPIGKPIANSAAFVLDEALNPLPPGADGELWLGGDGVARGYVNRSDLTSERFVHDPFTGDFNARLYRSGDRARWRPDGLLEFLGRNDDQVKVRGFRIELGEIESQLRKHEAVGDAAVVVTEFGSEKELAAYVVLRSNAAAGERELREWLSRSLPSYMLPHRIAVRGELPLTANGKVDRAALARATAAPAAQVQPKPAPGPERAIAQIWCDVLHRDVAPGYDENFFDAGGDSLRLLTVHARLRDQLGMNVLVTDLFEHSTIRKLATFVRREQARA